VAYWREGGILHCLWNGYPVNEQQAIERWPFVSMSPISHEEYQRVIEGGHWSDIDPVVSSQQKSPHGIGGNNPPDGLELLKDQIDSAVAGASAYKEISDDTTQAQAQSLRARLLELFNEADKRREEEKKPHWDAGKAVDAKWKPVIEAAKTTADAIKKAMSGWETKKANALREAQAEVARKAQKEALEAVKNNKPPPPPPPPPPPVEKTKIKGAYGKTASAKPVRVVKKITDQDALYQYFKGYPEVAEALMALSKKYLKVHQDASIPGVEIADEMEIR
jgi:hypothetical protein